MPHINRADIRGPEHRSVAESPGYWFLVGLLASSKGLRKTWLVFTVLVWLVSGVSYVQNPQGSFMLIIVGAIFMTAVWCYAALAARLATKAVNAAEDEAERLGGRFAKGRDGKADRVCQLRELADLKDSGTINDEEFQALKAEIMKK
jgi:hypothetical protein